MGEFLKVVSIELLVIHLTFRGAVWQKVNCFFWNFCFILGFSWFIYMVVLISGIKQSDSVIHSGRLVTKSCLTLSNPMDCSPPGSSVHGISQARILEWTAMPSSRGSSQPKDQTQVSYNAAGFFTSWSTREALSECQVLYNFVPFVGLCIQHHRIPIRLKNATTPCPKDSHSLIPGTCKRYLIWKKGLCRRD